MWNLVHTCVENPNLTCPACVRAEEANKALDTLRNAALVGQVQFSDTDKVLAHSLGVRLEDEPYDEFERRLRG